MAKSVGDKDPEQNILTATGWHLDSLAHPLKRKPGETDESLRNRALGIKPQPSKTAGEILARRFFEEFNDNEEYMSVNEGGLAVLIDTSIEWANEQRKKLN